MPSRGAPGSSSGGITEMSALRFGSSSIVRLMSFYATTVHSRMHHDDRNQPEADKLSSLSSAGEKWVLFTSSEAFGPSVTSQDTNRA